MRNLYISTLMLLGCICGAQVINFPDPNFKAKLLSASPSNTVAGITNTAYVTIDTNNNGEIEVSEALVIKYLSLDGGGITNLSGLEYFVNLYSLGVSDNPVNNVSLASMSGLHWLGIIGTDITTVDLSVVPELTHIWLNQSDFTTLDVSGLPNLTYFECQYGALASMDFSNNTQLNYLNCNGNSLTSLDLTQNAMLETLYCKYNQLTSLNVSGLANLEVIQCENNLLPSLNLEGVNLQFLECSDNLITTLNLLGQSNLTALYCTGNALTAIDLSACPLANQLYSSNCPNLTTLNLKNGQLFNQVQVFNCPNLAYMCVADNYVAIWQSNVNALGYDCTVNSYCSFTPGGIFYNINSTATSDADNNGCDTNDVTLPFFKLNVTNGTLIGSAISGQNGNVNIPLQQGVYTVTPEIENPAYFSVTPASFSVDFPAQTSPFQQDFCLTPIGNHLDVEVALVPTDIARPGFDSHYRLVLKNKGNVVSAGSVTLQFPDTLIDFVSSVPALTNFVDSTIIWDYSNLLPFETQIYDVVFNLNAPTETPPLNDADILQFMAVVLDGSSDDETPENNIAVVNQRVFNSFDPNDKTCLEGNVVGPEMIGQFVHYAIRFENTGSANAENIVVKDVIDTAKFDLTSLVPLASSHPFITRTLTGNKVEFIFENINLPFDDANNDGYVAFKIKTKPTLVVGDTFSNNASIYFDYNFPIVTNTATTTIQLLGTPDFAFSDAFVLYPNPVNNVLHIQSKNGLAVDSASIYNTLGQLLQTQTGNVSNLDVSQLESGSYFLKVICGNGSAVTKFIKR